MRPSAARDPVRRGMVTRLAAWRACPAYCAAGYACSQVNVSVHLVEHCPSLSIVQEHYLQERLRRCRLCVAFCVGDARA